MLASLMSCLPTSQAVSQRAREPLCSVGCAQGLGFTPLSHLDEHVVPDLDARGVVRVHQCARISAAQPVKVDLSARAAGTSVAHLPEVVLRAGQRKGPQREDGEAR